MSLEQLDPKVREKQERLDRLRRDRNEQLVHLFQLLKTTRETWQAYHTDREEHERQMQQEEQWAGPGGARRGGGGGGGGRGRAGDGMGQGQKMVVKVEGSRVAKRPRDPTGTEEEGGAQPDKKRARPSVSLPWLGPGNAPGQQQRPKLEPESPVPSAQEDQAKRQRLLAQRAVQQQAARAAHELKEAAKKQPPSSSQPPSKDEPVFYVQGKAYKRSAITDQLEKSMTREEYSTWADYSDDDEEG